MDETRLESWLEKRISTEVRLNWLGTLPCVLGGVLVLFMTYWIVYAIIYLGFDWLMPHSPAVRAIISGVVIALLFMGNARTSRAYLESLTFSTGTASDNVVHVYIPGVGATSNINPLAPDTMHAQVKVVTTILYVGPRLIMQAIHLAKKARRLRKTEIHTCASALAFMYSRPSRVSYEEIARTIPALKPELIFPQLAELDGVLTLASDPPGLCLSEELRGELTEVARGGLEAASGHG